MAFLLYIHGNDASVFLFCSLCLKCLSGHNACMHWTNKKKLPSSSMPTERRHRRICILFRLARVRKVRGSSEAVHYHDHDTVAASVQINGRQVCRRRSGDFFKGILYARANAKCKNNLSNLFFCVGRFLMYFLLFLNTMWWSVITGVQGIVYVLHSVGGRWQEIIHLEQFREMHFV